MARSPPIRDLERDPVDQSRKTPLKLGYRQVSRVRWNGGGAAAASAPERVESLEEGVEHCFSTLQQVLLLSPVGVPSQTPVRR